MAEFYCKSCGCSYTDDGKGKCRSCGYSNYTLYFGKRDTSINTGDKERISRTLGVAPNQIEKAREIHPDAEFTPDGDMIIRSRTEKKRRMRERTQFLRRQGSRINITEYD